MAQLGIILYNDFVFFSKSSDGTKNCQWAKIVLCVGFCSPLMASHLAQQIFNSYQVHAGSKSK